MVEEYREELHAEVLDDRRTAEYAYRCRMPDGLRLPGYATPEPCRLSRNLKMRETDVCFTSFPESGYTWLSQIMLSICTTSR